MHDFALVIALFLDLIASYGVMTVGLVDHNELAEVARETKAPKSKWADYYSSYLVIATFCLTSF